MVEWIGRYGPHKELRVDACGQAWSMLRCVGGGRRAGSGNERQSVAHPLDVVDGKARRGGDFQGEHGGERTQQERSDDR